MTRLERMMAVSLDDDTSTVLLTRVSLQGCGDSRDILSFLMPIDLRRQSLTLDRLLELRAFFDP